jgi:hypothetical protein
LHHERENGDLPSGSVEEEMAEEHDGPLK